jgi:uncharacterized membrane protein (UPF0182 family)
MGQRRWPLVVIGGLVLIVLVFTMSSSFWIDLQWFREVKLSQVYWTTLRTKLVLGLIGGLLFFAALLANLWIARWLRPSTRIMTPDQQVLQQLRDTVEPYLQWLLPVGVGVLALLVGVGSARQWQTFLLWRNATGVSFGNPEPLFGRDPAFYIFTLPWLRFVQGWLFSTLVGITFLTAIAHVFWGGIRPQAPVFADKVTPTVRAHLSVLLGLIMVVKAWGYYLGRFDLLTSDRGVVQGASYTDVKAQLPALNLLAVVAVICALLFLANIRVRLWSLPIIAVGLLAVISVLVGTAYPAFIQQFRVKPNEQTSELEYISKNIAGTRAAFGLDVVSFTQRDAADPLTAKDVNANRGTIDNIRLWRPGVIEENFRSLQRIKQYYEFNDVDVDRYTIGGEPRVVMISGREVSQAGIPGEGGTWQNQHLKYTHGFGAVAAQVNTATTEGQPVLTLKDIPPVGVPPITQPRIYFGEGEDVPFVVVKTDLAELDFERNDNTTQTETYAGEGGIPVGNFVQRAMFAWKFRDVNLMISGDIHADSRMMIYRDIYQRVPKPVPFLTFDYDPYLADVDGRLVWIWDAYTTSSEYPYSQSVDLETATDSLLGGELNYMRNSVKVVVDAYSGQMTYYADLSEPIVQVWSRAFPGLFTDIGQASSSLAAHFRYPENLFQVQAYQFANYHVTDPLTFYGQGDLWQIPDDPTVSVAPGAAAPKLKPYYLEMKLPGTADEGFQLVLPFVPTGRSNMVGWMAASSDPGEYPNVTAYRFPSGRNIEGPGQVFARINSDQEFSSDRSLLSQLGSDLVFGDFQVIPIEDTFLYVQPAYVVATQENTIPELKFVLVVNGSGGQVSQGKTLAEALAGAIEGVTPPPDGGGGTGTLAQRIQRLLNQALAHFQAADAALKAGDLGTYQDQLTLAQALVQRANELAATSGGETPTPSPPPTASPSLSPSPSPEPTASATAAP